MGLLRHRLFSLFLVILTLSVFTSDLIGDSLHDVAEGHSQSQSDRQDHLSHRDCASETHGCTPGTCAVCTCAIHTGAAVPAASEIRLTPADASLYTFPVLIVRAPDALPVAIDLPPQLG